MCLCVSLCVSVLHICRLEQLHEVSGSIVEMFESPRYSATKICQQVGSLSLSLSLSSPSHLSSLLSPLSDSLTVRVYMFRAAARAAAA